MAAGRRRGHYGGGRGGDTGGDGCQDVYVYATDGLSVVNAASTPYNIAAGGTDFSDVFSGTAATYWSATNGANF